MATFTQTQTTGFARVLGDRFQDIAYRLQARIDESRERRRIAGELNMYTDRELSELGFSRSDIHSIAAGTYRR